MRIAFTTLGCRLNQFESDALGRMARESGHQVVPCSEPADVVVVNTCAITHEADADSRQRVRQLQRRQPGARVVVTGCYASASPDEVARLPGVALVAGNAEKHALIEQIERLAGREPSAAGEDASAPVVHVRPGDLGRHQRVAALRPELAPERSRAYLKIQDGCDYRCSFCIVPSVRGRSASVPVATVRAQLAELIAADVPEVVLTGVHLGTYGRDLEPRVRLEGLITEHLLPLLRPGVTRLRLGSLDPHEVSPALVDALAEHGGRRLCRHLHLPVQSGDDGVLRRMRRAHTVRDLQALTATLARRVPGVALGTDVIVGFPGETDEDFDRTYALLESLPLMYLHVFPFSPRRGTAAWSQHAEQPVTPQRRAARSRALRELSRRSARDFAAAHVGAELDVVFHRRRHRRSGAMVALTDNYLRVAVESDDDRLLGALARVRIEEVDGDGGARGRLVDASIRA